MFGSNPLAALMAGRQARDDAPVLSAQHNRATELQEQMPHQPPRWAQALDGVGATLQDVGAARDGRAGGAVNRFSQAQAQMREAQEGARRRQLRFQQLRETIPSSDRNFWQAYMLGGEEAALQSLQARQAQQGERHTLGAGDTLTDNQGNVIAQGQDPASSMTTLMRNVAAAGYEPGTPEFQSAIRNQLTQDTGNPTLAGVIAPILEKVATQGEGSLSDSERQALRQYQQLTSRPESPQDAYFRRLMGGGEENAGSDPLGLRE